MKCLFLVALALLQADEKAIKDKHVEVMAFVKSAKAEREFRAAISDLEKLAEQAFTINKFELAAKVYSDADKIALNTLKDPQLSQSFQAAAKKAAEVGKEYTKASKAVGNILRNEGTPEDYTDSGRFLCFVKGDWELGLNDLAKGKDMTLKKLAEEDLAGASPIAIADAWFGLLKKEPSAKERALYWYGKAWPQLAGIEKEKVRERLTKLRGPVVPGKPVVPPPGWGGPVDLSHKLEGSTTCVHTGGAAARLTPGKNAKNASFLRSPEIQIPKGSRLTFSVWVLSDGTDKGDSIRYTVNSADGKPRSNDTLQIPTDMPLWVRLEKQLDLMGEAASAKIEIVVFSSTGNVWIDDLSLKVDGRELIKGGSFETP